MSLDVAAVRAHFPALAEGAAHFDSPGGSQVPTSVGRAVADTLTSAISNRGTVTAAERRADCIVTRCRAALADLLGADPRGVIFGRSMTQITYDVSRALAKEWHPGDEIVVTRLDHDANVRPWIQAAQWAGAMVRWADFDPETGELDPDAVADLVTDRTRLVAVTAASNLIGTRPDVPSITAAAHAVGALVYVDGVHATAHVATDVRELGADFYACSPYKFLGPHCGVVAADPALLETLRPDKLAPSSNDVPERFELGTLPYELMAGTTAAIDFLASLTGYSDAPTAGVTRREQLLASYALLETHEDALRRRIEDALTSMGATIYSRAERRTPTLLVRLPGVADGDVRLHLAHRGINAPNGAFYALEASRHLGLGDSGALRIGLAPYNDDHDVDRLLETLADLRPNQA